MLGNAYLIFPSSPFAEVPGFFEADFKAAKNAVGFVTLLLALVLAAAGSAATVFAETFASTFANGGADLAAAMRLDPFELTPEILLESSDCSRLIFLWSLGGFKATPLGCWPSPAFAVVFCFETIAALSRIFCAKALPWSSPLLIILGSTLSNFVFSSIDWSIVTHRVKSWRVLAEDLRLVTIEALPRVYRQ